MQVKNLRKAYKMHKQINFISIKLITFKYNIKNIIIGDNIMKCKKLFKCEILGIFLVILLGFLWHEIYDLLGKNLIVGMIAPVNESPWEHWKLVVFPMLIYAIIEYKFTKYENDNFLFSKFIGILAAILVCFGLIALFELIFPNAPFKTKMIVDIISFIIGIIAGQLTSYFIGCNLGTKFNIKLWYIAAFGITALVIIFIFFTLNPPMLNYFRDSITGKYGI